MGKWEEEKVGTMRDLTRRQRPGELFVDALGGWTVFGSESVPNRCQSGSGRLVEYGAGAFGCLLGRNVAQVAGFWTLGGP